MRRFRAAWIFAAFLATRLVSAESVLVTEGSSARYLRNASNPGFGTAWTAEGFDDAAWSSGIFGFGYETSGGAENLIQTPVASGAYSVYTRATFAVADASTVSNLFLGVDYDDGYVAWINGVEVSRSASMPVGVPSWNTDSASHESSNGSTPYFGPLDDISATASSALHDGVNVLAIGAWNRGAPSSSDMVLVPNLVMNKAVGMSRGPYLQTGTPTSVVVRWRTDLALDSRVRFGVQLGSPASVVSDATLTTEHEVTVGGLSPNTRYYYAVGSSDGDLAGNDADHFFLTSPPAGTAKPVRVWALGDSGTANGDARAVRDAYYQFTGARHTDLWLLLGDNAYTNGTDAQYQAALFDIYPEMLRKSVVWSTLGNHDGYSADSASQSGPYYDIFSLPAGGEAGGVVSGTEAYYSFDYADIHFVCLDSYESDRSTNGAMMTWLAQDLQDTLQDWIVAFWHHPPYSKGSHDSDVDAEMIQMRQNANPILEANGVDLVLSGHSHSYERSFLIDGHYGSSSTFNPGHIVDPGSGDSAGAGPYEKPALGPDPHEGAVYAVAGSSGKISGGSLDHPAMFVSVSVLGSVVLDFSGNRLDAKFLDDGANVVDSFSIVKDPDLPPVAEFTATPTAGMAPLDVAFTDLSLNGPISWSWDYDLDGLIESAERNPVLRYTDPGLYSVELGVVNAGGTGSMTKTGYVCVRSPGTLDPVTGVQFNSDRTSIPWQPHAVGSRYDVVRGDLGELRSSNGDFAAAVSSCILDDGSSSGTSDPTLPAIGAGLFYVVRAVDCAGVQGTYDDGSAAIPTSRDPGIEAALSSCP